MANANLFQAFDVSAAGLTFQRARLNAISANIANAQTTRTPDGGPYRRRVVTAGGPVGAPEGAGLFEKLLQAKRSLGLGARRTSPGHVTGSGIGRLAALDTPSIDFRVDVDREAPTRLEYEPGHPDANADGYVEYPNVEIVREMVDLMAASRAYEANVTVMQSTKAMLRKALEI